MYAERTIMQQMDRCLIFCLIMMIFNHVRVAMLPRNVGYLIAQVSFDYFAMIIILDHLNEKNFNFTCNQNSFNVSSNETFYQQVFTCKSLFKLNNQNNCTLLAYSTF